MQLLYHLLAMMCYLAGTYMLHASSAGKLFPKMAVCGGILFQALAVYEFVPVFKFHQYHVGVAIAHYALFAALLLVVSDRRVNFRKTWQALCLLAAAGSLLSIAPLQEHEFDSTKTGIGLHLGLATIAYGMFILSFVQMLEVLLRSRSISSLAAPIPKGLPLLEMENTVFRNVAVGFSFLTLTIASGSAVSLVSGQGAGEFTHKTLFAGLTWIFCAVLLIGRWRRGWRGAVALKWLAVSGGCLFLSYIGTLIVVDLILQR